jgi:hypothetical protein
MTREVTGASVVDDSGGDDDGEQEAEQEEGVEEEVEEEEWVNIRDEL